MAANKSFFQQLPTLPPLYTLTEGAIPDDQVFTQILELYLPRQGAEAVFESIHNLAKRVLNPDVLGHVVDAETHLPLLRSLTTFGEVNGHEPLLTSYGWKALKTLGVESGVVSTGYANPADTRWNGRVHQFGLIHVWTAASAETMCPMSMTDGVAAMLARHLAWNSAVSQEARDGSDRRAFFQETYRRLTSSDPAIAWTSGQWMTERAGGSDVSGTETTAQQVNEADGFDTLGCKLGPWRIDGAKWFSSAIDSDVTALLARTPQGLSAFLVPIRRCTQHSEIKNDHKTSTLNGIHMQRLKNKMGTRALPTAELVLDNARGWLLGTEGHGIREIATVLNITRLHVMSGSVGHWGRALAVCRAYSRVRRLRGGNPTADGNPVHVRWLADETVLYAGAMHFTFFCVGLLGHIERGSKHPADMGRSAGEAIFPKSQADCEALLRLLTPIGKACISSQATDGIRQAMECLGGVGYCENNDDGGWMNLARLFRDQVANTIWEGTANVMAEDVVRVITDRRLGGGEGVVAAVFTPWVRMILATFPPENFESERRQIENALNTLMTIVQSSTAPELKWDGRQLMQLIETIAVGALLVFNAGQNGSPLAMYLATRYIQSKAHILDPKTAAPRRQFCPEACAIDRLIFLGVADHDAGASPVSRL